MMNFDDFLKAHSEKLVDTAAVDRSGQLLVLHHATNKPFNAFEQSSDLGFHFGSINQAEKRRRNMISRQEAMEGDEWRIISCVLAIKNPLVIADDPGIWGPRWLTATLASYLSDGDRREIRKLAAILDQCKPGVSQAVVNCVRTWLSVLKNALGRNGHDGIIYRNIFESSGRAIEWSWLAFEDDQIIKIENGADLNSINPAQIKVGLPPKLRGAGPMRHHQNRGVGELIRQSDIVAFRNAVDNWAIEAGIEWTDAYPLDYEPSFGECRPHTDLRARIGVDEGYIIQVSSKRGLITLYPFSKSESFETQMRRYSLDASEGFFDQGLSKVQDDEIVCWRPAETIHNFVERLAAVHTEFEAEFSPQAKHQDQHIAKAGNGI